MIKADIVDLVVDLADIPRAKAATAVETVIESMRSARREALQHPN